MARFLSYINVMKVRSWERINSTLDNDSKINLTLTHIAVHLRLMYLNFLPGNTLSLVDQLVERQTSNPEVQGVQGSIPAWENQNL